MTESVNCKIVDHVATLTINNGKANAISHEVIEQFHQGLDLAEQNKCVVVLTGTLGMFSGGYDLKVMSESQQSAIKLVEQGSKLARRLLAFPYPVVVACTGHAVAKGAFLLLAADYRIGVKGQFKIGLNEVAIGIPMHQVGIKMAEYRLPSHFFTRSVLLAEMFSPEQAVEAGFLDQVVAPEELDSTLTHITQGLRQLNMTAHTLTKLKARNTLLAQLDNAIECDRLNRSDA